MIMKQLFAPSVGFEFATWNEGRITIVPKLSIDDFLHLARASIAFGYASSNGKSDQVAGK